MLVAHSYVLVTLVIEIFQDVTVSSKYNFRHMLTQLFVPQNWCIHLSQTKPVFSRSISCVVRMIISSVLKEVLKHIR